MDCSFISTTRCNDSLSHPSNAVSCPSLRQSWITAMTIFPSCLSCLTCPVPPSHETCNGRSRHGPDEALSVNKQLHLSRTSFRNMCRSAGRA